MPEMEPHTLPALLRRNALQYGDKKVALREKEFGIWQAITWRQYYEDVRDFALGFCINGGGRTFMPPCQSLTGLAFQPSQ